MDLRYLRKGKFSAETVSESFSSVVSFLESVYYSIAENLPDVRDGTLDDEECDAYAELATSEEGIRLSETAVPSKVSASQPNAKSSRLARHRRGVDVNPLRTAQGCEVRWLPPGAMKDYWIQYRSQLSDGVPVASFVTFWRVTWLLVAVKISRGR